MHVLESDDYHKEIADLKQDPLVLEMAHDLFEDEIVGWKDIVESSAFPSLALSHYNAESKRLGAENNAKTIGGVGRAIKELIEEWSKSDGTD